MSDYLARVAAAAARTTTTARPPFSGPVLMPAATPSEPGIAHTAMPPVTAATNDSLLTATSQTTAVAQKFTDPAQSEAVSIPAAPFAETRETERRVQPRPPAPLAAPSPPALAKERESKTAPVLRQQPLPENVALPIALPTPVQCAAATSTTAQAAPTAAARRASELPPPMIHSASSGPQPITTSERRVQANKPQATTTAEPTAQPKLEVANAELAPTQRRAESKSVEPLRLAPEPLAPPPMSPPGKPQPRITIGRLEVQVLNQPPPAPPRRIITPAPVQVDALETRYLNRFSLRV